MLPSVVVVVVAAAAAAWFEVDKVMEASVSAVDAVSIVLVAAVSDDVDVSLGMITSTLLRSSLVS